MFSWSTASPGMMFGLLPAWTDPTDTTAASVMPISLETTVWSRITVAAAITTGSTVVCGDEPWPPRPNRVTRKLSL
jgi:hypothetical protein